MSTEKQLIPMAQVLFVLRDLCARRETGAFFVATESGHWAEIVIEKGDIIGLRFRNRKGLAAAQSLAQVTQAKYSFSSVNDVTMYRVTLATEPIPSTDDLLQMLMEPDGPTEEEWMEATGFAGRTQTGVVEPPPPGLNWVDKAEPPAAPASPPLRPEPPPTQTQTQPPRPPGQPAPRPAVPSGTTPGASPRPPVPGLRPPMGGQPPAARPGEATAPRTPQPGAVQSGGTRPPPPQGVRPAPPQGAPRVPAAQPRPAPAPRPVQPPAQPQPPLLHRPAQPQQPVPVAPAPAAAPPANAKKVLVVEDSTISRTVITRTLSRKGYRIIEAEDGFQALAQLTNEMPDLVLLDLIMPGMDGYKVLSHMKKKEEFAKIPVIILTSRDTLFDKLRGKMSGSDEYLTKPFSSTELLDKVSQYLD